MAQDGVAATSTTYPASLRSRWGCGCSVSSERGVPETFMIRRGQPRHAPLLLDSYKPTKRLPFHVPSPECSRSHPISRFTISRGLHSAHVFPHHKSPGWVTCDALNAASALHLYIFVVSAGELVLRPCESRAVGACVLRSVLPRRWRLSSPRLSLRSWRRGPPARLPAR